jgi:hypothetical protein
MAMNVQKSFSFFAKEADRSPSQQRAATTAEGSVIVTVGLGRVGVRAGWLMRCTGSSRGCCTLP